VPQVLEIQARSYRIIQDLSAQPVYLVFPSHSVSSPESLVYRRELRIIYNVAQIKFVVKNPLSHLIHWLALVLPPHQAQSPSNRLEISNSQKPNVNKVGNVSATCFVMPRPQWYLSEWSLLRKREEREEN